MTWRGILVGPASPAPWVAVLAWAAGPVSGDGLARVLLPSLGIHDLRRHDPPAAERLDLWNRSDGRKVGVTFGSGDLVRRWIEGVRVAGASSRGARLWASLPFQRAGLSHRLTVQASAGALRSRGRSRDPGWSGRLDAGESGGRLEYAVGNQGLLVGASAAGWTASGQDQVVALESFHHSPDDARMNRYFWDLLEPTFGRRLVGDWRFPRWEAEAGAVAKVGPRGSVGLSGSVARETPGVGVSYTNTGDREELAGPRRAEVEQTLTARRYGLAYQRVLSSAWTMRLEGDHLRQELEARSRQLQVPRSSRGVLLDIVELGRGQGRRRGTDVRLRAFWSGKSASDAEALLGWGTWSFDAEGRGTTPVLGFSLGALPVSHRAEADLSGRLRTGVAALQAQWRGRRGQLGLGALSARSAVNVNTRADAQMEFGLYVEPYRDRLRFRVDLHRFVVAPQLRLSGPWWLGYRMTQYLVFARDLDRRRPPPPREEKLRGGTLQDLTIWYAL